MQNFFVYGTLKSGYHNNSLLHRAKKVGDAITKENYLLTDCGFPFAAPKTNGRPVIGEVWEVDDQATVNDLDRLEGNGQWYNRREVDVTLDSGETRKAWLYEVDEDYASGYRECNTEQRGEVEAYIWSR